MSLMQQACDTYVCAETDFCGVYDADLKEPLAPVGHTITKADLEITIDGNGHFLRADAVPPESEKTIFPVTEESAGRTSKAVAHPLCEQLQYLCPQNRKKFVLYTENLAAWEASEYTHPVLTAVLRYVRRGTILEDLASAGLIKTEADGKLKNEKDFVRWIVTGIGEESGACWKNRRLQQAFIGWYESRQTEKADYCMVSGERATPAKQHAKGIVAANGNAKLVSANDIRGFTYRGRFQNDAEALCVGYDASQKAHNALRWVIANQGIFIGGRSFVCWNPQGQKLPRPTGILRRQDENAEKADTAAVYDAQLQSAADRWKGHLPDDAKTVTAVFDAATSGRLSLLYYSELQAGDFVDRLAAWERICCWPNGDFGIQSPSLFKIVQYSFGEFRAHGFETDDSIAKQIMLQLYFSRIEQEGFPTAIERALVLKAGNLKRIPDDKEHKYARRDLLFTACAAIRKYRYDAFGEKWSMTLEPEEEDSSYQFGRLMAVLEKMEKDAFYGDEKHESGIIRRQREFIIKPYAVALSVLSGLKITCYPRLYAAARERYERQIAVITEKLNSHPEDLNKPLGDTYLFGYYLQKKELYKSWKEKTEE